MIHSRHRLNVTSDASTELQHPHTPIDTIAVEAKKPKKLSATKPAAAAATAAPPPNYDDPFGSSTVANFGSSSDAFGSSNAFGAPADPFADSTIDPFAVR
jgi:hypothetical protein